MNKAKSEIFNGAAAAAVLAAGIGSFILGVLTTLKASSQAIRNFLSFYVPTGPLSGQTTVAVAVWLVAWVVFHLLWKGHEVNFKKIFIIALILIVLGMIGTFPPLFEAFFEAYE
jgi:hypothetical protein